MTNRWPKILWLIRLLVIDYSLIIGNNQWLTNWLPIDYLLITHWFHWCHWCYRLVMSGHVVLEWAFKKAFKTSHFKSFHLQTNYRSSKCMQTMYPRLSLSFLWLIHCIKFSVFTSHVIKTKNRNHSVNRVKNLGYDRRLIYKQPRQESGLCCFSFARYLQKCVCVLRRDTNMAAVGKRSICPC